MAEQTWVARLSAYLRRFFPSNNTKLKYYIVTQNKCGYYGSFAKPCVYYRDLLKLIVYARCFFAPSSLHFGYLHIQSVCYFNVFGNLPRRRLMGNRGIFKFWSINVHNSQIVSTSLLSTLLYYTVINLLAYFSFLGSISSIHDPFLFVTSTFNISVTMKILQQN